MTEPGLPMSRTQGAKGLQSADATEHRRLCRGWRTGGVVSTAQLACGYCLGSHQEVEKGGNEKIGWAGVGRKWLASVLSLTFIGTMAFIILISQPIIKKQHKKAKRKKTKAACCFHAGLTSNTSGSLEAEDRCAFSVKKSLWSTEAMAENLKWNTKFNNVLNFINTNPNNSAYLKIICVLGDNIVPELTSQVPQLSVFTS